MAQIALVSGAYQAKSVIANAQRCVNLYPEVNPRDTQPPEPVTHYLTPGLTLLHAGDGVSPIRCEYRASSGKLYIVRGANIYYVDSLLALNIICSVGGGITPVYMSDNGLVITVVYGETTGIVIDMATNAFSIIKDNNFYGATRCDFLDTFFLFNRPNTNQFYISTSNADYIMFTIPAQITAGAIANAGSGYVNATYTNVPFDGGAGTGATANVIISGNIVTTVSINQPGINYVIGDTLTINAIYLGNAGSGFSFLVNEVTGRAFDPLDIAAKNGFPDNIETLIVIQGYVWLIGQVTSEVWFNSGAADFTFARLPGVNIVQHGTGSPYSVAAQDLFPYWVSQDQQGQNIILKAANYQPQRISTHALENEMASYPTVADCISYIYQQEGHTFIVFNFPTANKTWAYDEATGQWHERCWTDENGNLNRSRVQCCANVYNKIIVGDWQNGNLYEYDMDNATDNGQPITRIRSFPHISNSLKRVFHTQILLDMAVGSDDGSIDGSTQSNPPTVLLRYSDDRGVTYGNYLEQSLGAAGQYLTSVQYNRLGLARDRVYEVLWSAPIITALQGAYLTTSAAQS